MDERTQQIIEDSEKIRDRNRDLEGELHGLKVENERLKEENEALFATQGGSDPQNLRDALKWLHDQGGIGAVYSLYKDVVLGEAEEVLEVVYSEDIEKRLMPEGMEWPRFEDGEPVRIGEEYECWCGETHKVNSITIREGSSIINATNVHSFVVSDGPTTAHGKRVKRPATKVPDADGVEIRVGDTVWTTNGLGPFEVTRIVYADRLRVIAYDEENGRLNTAPKNLAHRAPALAADGRPLREGETVWGVDSGTKYVVEKITDELIPIKCCSGMGFTASLYPSQLTHERPDSWERLEEDAGKNPFDYCKDVGHRLDTCENSEAYKSRDLVRRAKKLAGDA